MDLVPLSGENPNDRVRETLMKQTIGYVALVVRGYDEAITFYTKSLRFTLIEDTALSDGKRWVLVAPPNSQGTCLLLAKASTPEQESRIGNQTGGRVFLFLHTDDFWRDYHDMQARGVKFREEPRQESHGTVVVFEDLYGNKWDLVESKRPPTLGLSYRPE
jgi:lactoylglutathione lyase